MLNNLSTIPNREHPGSFENKSVSSSYKWMSRCVLFLAKLKKRGIYFFFGGCKKGGRIVRLLPTAIGCYNRWKKPLLDRLQDLSKECSCHQSDPPHALSHRWDKKVSKKGQLQGRLKQLNLEKVPRYNTR